MTGTATAPPAATPPGADGVARRARRAPRLRLRTGLAGALAAAVALVVGEVVGLLAPTRPSLLIAVQTWFVDRFAASLKTLAIELFGTNDKIALAAGTVVVCLLLGAVLAELEVRRPYAGVAGLALFGVVGVVATWRDPQASFLVGTLAAVAATAAGGLTLLVLLDRFGVRGNPLPALRRTAEARGPLGEVTATRRDVLVWGAGTGAVVVVGAGLTREARAALRDRAVDIPDRLPAAVRPAEAPTSAVDVDGITPYIVPNRDFYRIDTALQTPVVDTGSWRLRITGMVDREVELTYADLLGRDLVEEIVTLACVSNEVGGSLVGNAVWRGIPLRDLLDEAGVQAGATQLVGESVDGFTAGFPTAVLDDPDRPALVAVGMNGVALPTAHGFPARLVVSGLYGYVSATKWLSEIRLTTLEDEDGYWIPRGWAKEGPIKTQSRIDVPRFSDVLTPGPQPIAGVAWAQNRGISAVEVRVDDGEWMPAELGRVPSDDTWVQWYVMWDATPGEHSIDVRATDGDGEVQTAEEAPVDPDGATGWHRRRARVGR